MDHIDWLICQLADSAFPAGGFAHSGGLEAAVQHNWAAEAHSLEAIIRCQLQTAAHLVVPFVAAAHREPESLPAFDDVCDASINNHVANRESRAQGQGFILAASRVFTNVSLTDLGARLRSSRSPGHFPPIFGAVTRFLGIELDRSIMLFLFSELRGLVSAAVRLGIAGPMEGQTVQWRLSSFAAGLVVAAMERSIEDVVQTAPLLDLLQGTQDRLYSRLFQS